MSMEASQFLSFGQTVVGGLLSLAGSFGAIWWAKRTERNHEAHQLARAFKGEIASLAEIVRFRGYVDDLRAAARTMRETNRPVTFVVQIRQQYRVVYLANAGKIGLLGGELPVLLATIYTQVASALEDFEVLYDTGTKPDFARWDAHALAGYLERLADLLEDTVGKAQRAILLIDEMYPPTR